MSDLAKLKRASPPCPRALPETDLLSGARFEEFQAVAPRIFGVEAASAGERIVVGQFNFGGAGSNLGTIRGGPNEACSTLSANSGMGI